MKKFLSAIGYFMASAVLFLGGVTLEVIPSGGSAFEMPGQYEDWEFPDSDIRDTGTLTQDDTETPKDSVPEDDPAPGDAPAGEEPQEKPQEDLEEELQEEPQEEEPKEELAEEGAEEAEENTKNPDALYYYSLLNYEQKEYYEQIRGAAASGERSVTLFGITYEEAEPIVASVQYDYPEYFWIENSYSYLDSGNSVEIIFNYNCEGNELAQRQRIIEAAASEILSAAPVYGSDYDKVEYVFETLIDRTQYDLTAPDNQNIYSVFGNWTTVCAGYAKATKYLLDQLGVECIYLTGMGGDELHAWNIVNCDGSYYYVDTTWGDPTYQGEIGENIDTTSYEYLCCPQEMLFRTHTPDAAFPLPECTDTSLEYYRMQGRYLETADQEAILEIMRSDIDKDRARTEIQFSTPEIFSQVIGGLEPLLQTAMDYEMAAKNLSSSNISYQYREPGCVLIVYWSRH